jgi:UDP-glucose 4-epimerase
MWCRCVQGNICSADLVNYVLQEEEIDTIMHFAAQTHVGASHCTAMVQWEARHAS